MKLLAVDPQASTSSVEMVKLEPEEFMDFLRGQIAAGNNVFRGRMLRLTHKANTPFDFLCEDEGEKNAQCPQLRWVIREADEQIKIRAYKTAGHPYNTPGLYKPLTIIKENVLDMNLYGSSPEDLPVAYITPTPDNEIFPFRGEISEENIQKRYPLRDLEEVAADSRQSLIKWIRRLTNWKPSLNGDDRSRFVGDQLVPICGQAPYLKGLEVDDHYIKIVPPDGPMNKTGQNILRMGLDYCGQSYNLLKSAVNIVEVGRQGSSFYILSTIGGTFQMRYELIPMD